IRSAAKPDRRTAFLRRAHGAGDQRCHGNFRGHGPARVGACQSLASSRTLALRLMSMDPQRWQQLKAILSDAFDEESTDARRAYVERSCSGDDALLREAESLLAEAEILRRSASDDLEACAENASQRIRRQVASQIIGKRIGAYVVTREIGRGGMGTVYLAARADGYFEKEVAIKLLFSGIDTEEMVQHFHAERRVL